MNTNVSKITFQDSVIVSVAKLNGMERERVRKCRDKHNRLGFCYQLMFFKIFNRFPSQTPIEIQHQILMFASLELEIPVHQIDTYQERQAKLSDHQTQIKQLLRRCCKKIEARKARVYS